MSFCSLVSPLAIRRNLSTGLINHVVTSGNVSTKRYLSFSWGSKKLNEIMKLELLEEKNTKEVVCVCVY